MVAAKQKRHTKKKSEPKMKVEKANGHVNGHTNGYSPNGIASASRIPSMLTAGPKKARATSEVADFVRSLPFDLPVADVIAKAKEAGLKPPSVAYVHTIRWQAKVKRGEHVPKRRKPGIEQMNRALLMSAAKHANSDRLVKKCAEYVLELLAASGVMNFSINLQTKKVETICEQHNTMVL